MRGVSGELRSSRCCTVLGPSSADKTIFMSLLTGKAQRTSDRVQINGVDAPLSNYGKLIGFVSQEDIMLCELTVRDILMVS
jgi:ABC-type multidrug transport system ATPase subunit